MVINAAEALPNGGAIHILTKQLNGDASSKNNVNETQIEIVIADTGTGMTEDFLNNHLFKPFKTTKKKGLGIGLYHCREIINAHGGTIEVESKLNEGTRFKVILPISNGCVSNNEIPIDYDKTLSLN